MSLELQKIVLLLLVAVVMLVMNLKAGYVWVAILTFVSMIGALLGALWLTVQWVFLA